jgi:tetratricopeptide (TPR) repeat protein
MRVPLIIAAPGLFSGPVVVNDRVVSTTDLFPTLAHLFGLSDAPGSTGRNLLAGGAPDDRRVYLESLVPLLDHGWSPLFGLRRHHDKFIRAPSPEFYALDTDPGELRNLYPDAAESAVLEAELEELLAGWPDVEGVRAEAMQLDPETVKRLASLGYVSGGGLEPDEVRHDPKEMMPLLEQPKQAKRLAARGKPREALAELNEVVAASPGSHRILGLMARLQAQLGQEDRAEEMLRKTLAVKRNPIALVFLAQIVLKAGRTDEAGDLLVEAIVLEPGYGGAWIARGDLAAALGAVDEVDAHYSRAAEVDPHRAAATARQRRVALRGDGS